MNGLSNALEKIIKSISLVLLILILSLLFIKQIGNLLAVSISIFAIYFFYKKDISNKKFLIGLIIIAVLIRFGIVLQLHNPQLSDFGTLYNISQELVDRNISENSQKYLNIYNYQSPFIIYQSGILFVFHRLIALKFINVILSILSLILMYRIISRISSKKSAQTITFLYSIFINVILYNSVLSNQHIFSFLILLSFEIFQNDKIIKNKYLKIFICSFIIGIANLIRPEGILCVLTFLAFFIYQIFKKEINIKEFGTKIVILLATYLLVTNVPIMLLRENGFMEQKSINDNLYKVVLGLDISSNGRWSEKKYSQLYSYTNKSELRAYEIQEIKKSLLDIRIFKLFIIKIVEFWNDFDFSWSIGYLWKSKIGSVISFGNFYTFISSYDSTLWLIIVFIALYGIIKNEDKNRIIYLILLIGVFLTYLLIEVQGRYAFPYRIYIFIIAGSGLETLLENIKRKYWTNQKK